MSGEAHSVRWLQSVLLAAIIIPLTIFIFGARQSYLETQQSTEDQINRSLDILNEHALKVFEVVERTMAEVNEIIRGLPDDAISASEPQLHERLDRMVRRSPEIKSIWIFDASGHALANNLVSPAPSIDFSDRDYFKAHVERPIGTYVGQILRPRAPYGGAPFFGVSVRRTAPTGDFTGVIQVSVLPEYFESFYGKISRASGSYHSLIRPDGFILSRFPSLEGDMTLPRKGPVMAAIAQNPSYGTLTVKSLVDGVRRTVSYRRLSELPIYVLSGRETEAVQREWVWHEAQRLLYGLPLTAALVLVIALALRRTRRMFEEAHKRKIAEDALKQAQRLEALGRLTGGVAHDFNNLLMVVRGGASKLMRLGLSDARAQSAIHLIDEAAKKGESLTRRLLAFSRHHSLAPKVCNLGEQLLLIRNVLEQSIRVNILLEIALPPNPLFTKLDPDDLEIALLNLALNSRDAMPEGGKITIELSEDEYLGRPAALITFSDTGSGIPYGIRDRIFEPFFTTKTVDKGTGLGLSQVYGFVSQSRGHIKVESEEGQGTSFKLWLPLTAERPAKKDINAERPTKLPATKVLLVEDNKEVAAVATEYLEQLKLTVVHANSAEAALEVLKLEKKVDLVFSDIVMPGITGVEFARLVRKDYPHLPMILATGYSDQAEIAKREKFPLLRKPYTFDSLRQVLRQTLASSHAEFRDAG